MHAFRIPLPEFWTKKAKVDVTPENKTPKSTTIVEEMKKKTLDFLESQINEIYTRLKTFLVSHYTPTITKTTSLSTLMEGIDLLADRVLSSELEASLRSLQHVPGAWEAFKTKLGYEGIVCEYDTEKPSFTISIPGIQHWAKELDTVTTEPTSEEAPKD